MIFTSTHTSQHVPLKTRRVGVFTAAVRLCNSSFKSGLSFFSNGLPWFNTINVTLILIILNPLILGILELPLRHLHEHTITVIYWSCLLLHLFRQVWVSLRKVALPNHWRNVWML